MTVVQGKIYIIPAVLIIKQEYGGVGEECLTFCDEISVCPAKKFTKVFEHLRGTTTFFPLSTVHPLPNSHDQHQIRQYASKNLD